jgi:hypothetical protein
MPRPLWILALCALALAGVGCGNRIETRTVGETEGLYVDIGELRYQVQISRILNPDDIEDRAYLEGLPEGTAPPSGEEAWFAIFLRVENSTDDKQLEPATEFEIADTQENTFEPYDVRNPFAYAPRRLGPGNLIPHPDSAAGAGPIQGSLLLFKVTTEALGNRPLEFKIKHPSNPDEVGIVDLDV